MKEDGSLYWTKVLRRLEKQRSQINKLIIFIVKYQQAGILWLMPKSIENKIERLSK